jgi:hypothetical protein
MICGCGVSGVLCTVLEKNYYYCRECKKEIELEAAKVATTDPVLTKEFLDFESTFSQACWGLDNGCACVACTLKAFTKGIP